MAKLNLNWLPPELPPKMLLLPPLVDVVIVDSMDSWLLSSVLLVAPDGSVKLKRKSAPDVSRADFLTKLDFLFVSADGVNLICLEAEKGISRICISIVKKETKHTWIRRRQQASMMNFSRHIIPLRVINNITLLCIVIHSSPYLVTFSSPLAAFSHDNRPGRAS